MSVQTVALLIAAVVVAVALIRSVRIVPQAEEYVVERLGRYQRTLEPGMRLLVPIIEQVKSKVSVLERQLSPWEISVITKDNVEVRIETTVFLRVVEAERAVYRIRDFEVAVRTATTSIVRNEGGKLDLDELQSARESMGHNIHERLQEAATVWGLEVTRSELLDVIVDDETKEAQRQQLNAERERRARVAKAEGERRATELAADAALYEAQKRAEAVRVSADARAYEIRTVAEAEKGQIERIGEAIREKGEEPVLFEIRKRQIEALGALAGTDNTKTLVVPTAVTGVLGAVESLRHLLEGKPTQ